jgi:hypothetical protein
MFGVDIGIGIGLGRQRVVSFTHKLVLQYIARIKADGGYYEATQCLENKLNALR